MVVDLDWDYMLDTVVKVAEYNVSEIVRLIIAANDLHHLVLQGARQRLGHLDMEVDHPERLQVWKRAKDKVVVSRRGIVEEFEDQLHYLHPWLFSIVREDI